MFWASLLSETDGLETFTGFHWAMIMIVTLGSYFLAHIVLYTIFIIRKSRKSRKHIKEED